MSGDIGEAVAKWSHLRAAAWLPDDDANLHDWDRHEHEAVEWVMERARQEGVRPIVHTDTKNASPSRGVVGVLAQRYGTSSSLDRPHGEKRVVLAYYPNPRALVAARSIAQGSSLCVVESAMMSVAGWAGALGAHDVTGVYPEPPHVSDDVRKTMDSAIFFQGRNNWTGAAGKADLRRRLARLVQDGLADVDLLVGYALAHDSVDERGVKNLQEQLGRYRF